MTPDESSMTGRFITCEKKGEWAIALRWAAEDLPLRIFETRSLAECKQELQQFPASFLAIEAMVANVDSVVQILADVHTCYSEARMVVLADRSLQAWEDVLREAGALHVAFSPRRLHSIVRMAYRHLVDTMHFQSEVSFEDTIRARMPWPK